MKRRKERKKVRIKIRRKVRRKVKRNARHYLPKIFLNINIKRREIQ
jgi:hypothetical protein